MEVFSAEKVHNNGGYSSLQRHVFFIKKKEHIEVAVGGVGPLGQFPANADGSTLSGAPVPAGRAGLVTAGCVTGGKNGE